MKPAISLYISLIHLIESVRAKIYFPHNFCVAGMMYFIVSRRLCHPNRQLPRMASPASELEGKGDDMKSCCIGNGQLFLPRWR